MDDAHAETTVSDQHDLELTVRQPIARYESGKLPDRNHQGISDRWEFYQLLQKVQAFHLCVWVTKRSH